MASADILSFTINAMILVLLLSMPPILVATVCGLGVSLLQALTQIQEQTLSFAVKLIAVSVTILLTAHWLGGEIYNYTLSLFDSFPLLVK